MKLSLEEFTTKVGGLDAEMKNLFEGGDGLMDRDFSKYYKSEPRILWLLKEPYGSEKIHLRNIVESVLTSGDFSLMWQNIIHTSYGIIKGKLLNEMPKIQECQGVLKQIAIIDIKKTSGGTTTNDAALKKYYDNPENHAFELIKKQLDLYQPDVVIGGNTLKYEFLKKDLELKDLVEGSQRCYIKDNRLYISAYHPANWTTPNYVDDIVNNAKTFLPQIKK